MRGAEPAFGAEPRLALAQRRRIRRQMPRDLAQRNRGTAGPVAMNDDAVDDVELVRRGLQQLGGHVQRLGAQLQRRGMGRAAGHHRGARGMRADAVGDAVGLAVHDPHAAVIDAERIGADLRHRRGEALPDIGAAGDQLDRAGGIDADARAVGGAEPALVDKHADPGADQFAGRATLLQARLATRSSRCAPAPCRATAHSRRNRRQGRCRARRAAGRTASRPSAIRLRRRTSTRSRPSRSATASISRSRTKLPS